jgi:RNA polymerase sigma-70 factor (ECF subfamily)
MQDEIAVHLEYLYNVAYRLTGDTHDAEDLAHEVVLKALEQYRDLRDRNALKSWLRKITLNLYLQRERRKGIVAIEPRDDIISMAEAPVLSPEQEVLIDETVREIQDTCFTVMTTQLTLQQRIVFTAVELFGMEIPETAELLDLSGSACRALLHRARRNLLVFFRRNCQLIFSDLEGKCTCESWKKVIHQREILKKNVRRKHAAPPFDHPEYLETELDDSAGKVLYLFRSMPERKPENRWFNDMTREMNRFTASFSEKK